MYTPQFDLFVGSEDPYLATEALSYNTRAKLLLEKDIQDFLRQATGCVYTSLADSGNLENLLSLCLQANKIFYRPPPHWATLSNNKQKYWTEHILWYVDQYKKIDGLTKDSSHVLCAKWYDTHHVARTHSVLWTIGCSITAGVGVSPGQAWPQKVADHLCIPLQDLAKKGTSILWQANQICQSAVKPNDLVFWGLTSHHRIPMLEHNDILEHTGAGHIEKFPNKVKIISLDFLNSPTLIYLNTMAIRNVYNFCNQIKAKLVIVGLMHDFDSTYRYYDVPVFRQYAVWPNKFVDLGTDNEHPGPIQHQLYANEFINFYNETYQRNISPMAQDLMAK